jgi:hypothetical protein
MGILSDGKKFRLWSISRRRGWSGVAFDHEVVWNPQDLSDFSTGFHHQV